MKQNETIKLLESVKPTEVVSLPEVRAKFIDVYNTVWGNGQGEAAYEREREYFNKQLRENTTLQKAIDYDYLCKQQGRLLAMNFSIYNTFIEIAVSGLSIEPGTRALAYIVGKNVNVGTPAAPLWEGQIRLVISAYGELAIRMRQGQVRHVDNPVVVYANDEFSFSDRNGRKEVDYTCHLPHKGQPIVACYLRITRADGSIDYSVMTEEDWTRLAAYSAKQNKKTGANALYGVDAQGNTHIDAGFLMAKCIKHAFRTYQKVKIGKAAELESEQEEEVPAVAAEPSNNLYGAPNEVRQDAVGEAVFSAAEVGVTVETGDDDAF